MAKPAGAGTWATNTLVNEAESPAVSANEMLIAIVLLMAGPTMLGIGAPKEAGPIEALWKAPAVALPPVRSEATVLPSIRADQIELLGVIEESVPPLPSAVMPPATEPPMRVDGVIGVTGRMMVNENVWVANPKFVTTMLPEMNGSASALMS